MKLLLAKGKRLQYSTHIPERKGKAQRPFVERDRRPGTRTINDTDSMHKATEKALLQLQKRILNGEWGENCFLPPERRLCEELEVGRGAIAAIFRELACRGLISMEPGRGARVLRGNTGNSVLRQILVVENSNCSISNSAEHLQLLDHLAQVAASYGIGLSLAFRNADTIDRVILERYVRNEIQAVIVIERPELVNIELLLRHGIPTVIVNFEAEGKYPCVRVDFREIGRIAGREFVKSGLFHVGVLSGDADSFFCREMVAGLRGVLAEEEVALDKGDIICWPSSADRAGATSGEAAMSGQALWNLLRSPKRPEAFFVIRDWRAAKLYDFCARLQLEIPRDLSIISYDNLSWQDAAAVGLTTISEPTRLLAQQSINMVRQWKRIGERPDDIKVKGVLVPRSSVRADSSFAET